MCTETIMRPAGNGSGNKLAMGGRRLFTATVVGTGKVLLAFAGDLHEEVARLGEMNRLTSTTITSPRELLHDLEEIRKRGFSINRGERIPGVYGVAASLHHLNPGTRRQFVHASDHGVRGMNGAQSSRNHAAGKQDEQAGCDR